MHLETAIVIQRPPEEVWAYLGDISNVSKWDRGVSATRQTSHGPSGVGLEFDTLAHPKGKVDGGEWGKCRIVSWKRIPFAAARSN